jgi:hypothetical protein
VRVVTLAALAALSAVVAHAGPTGIGQATWLGAALAGALVAAGALIAAARAVGVRRREVVFGGSVGGLSVLGIQRVPVSAVLGSMLVCQWGAHVALQAAGMPGDGASPLLHVVLGLLAALLFLLADRILVALMEGCDRIVAWLVLALAAPRQTFRPHGPAVPRRWPQLRPGLGRGPPLLASA